MCRQVCTPLIKNLNGWQGLTTLYRSHSCKADNGLTISQSRWVGVLAEKNCCQKHNGECFEIHFFCKGTQTTNDQQVSNESNNTSLMSNWRQLQQATNQSINQSTFFWFNSVLKSLLSALIHTQNVSVEVFNNYSSSQNGPLALWANDSEAMRARGIIILVKSNYLVKNIETKQL